MMKLTLSLFLLMLPSSAIAQVGTASYYGKQHHGRRMANGKLFNMNAKTVAHKTLPFGTRVKATNLVNDKSVIVTVTDRGPFIKGRIADFSVGAAKALGMMKSGTTKVKLEVLNETNNL